MTAAFDGIEVPFVASAEVSREILGDRGRTAGGRMRLDVYAIKRTWEIRTHPITLAQARALIDHLDTFMFRSGDFWIIDFDTDGDQLPSAEESVRAYITDIREEYVPFGRDGVWHADGRQLTITVEEE